MIYCVWQVLEVLHKELLWVFNILRQWLHHAEHLTHIRFRLLKDALNSFTMQLTAMLVEIARSGQTSELNDVKCIGFVMNVSGHPLQDPSLRISAIPADVKCGIELEQQLFIPMLLVSYERQQSNFFEAIQSFFQTGQTSYSFNVKALVWEDATLVVKNA